MQRNTTCSLPLCSGRCVCAVRISGSTLHVAFTSVPTGAGSDRSLVALKAKARCWRVHCLLLRCQDKTESQAPFSKQRETCDAPPTPVTSPSPLFATVSSLKTLKDIFCRIILTQQLVPEYISIVMRRFQRRRRTVGMRRHQSAGGGKNTPSALRLRFSS